MYGLIMFLNLGCAPTIVVSSADMAKEIIKANDIIFSNWPETMTANFLYYERERERERERESQTSNFIGFRDRFMLVFRPLKTQLV